MDGVPTEAIDFLAGQLRIADPSCVKRYAVRPQTHREHAGKICEALKLKDFAQVEAQVAVFVSRRAWVTGDGPKAIFADALRWLRERDVLLPGVSRLARLVARERDAATQRLWETLSVALTDQQRRELDALPVVGPGSRVSELERWRTGPARASGPQLVKALHRVAEIIGSGLSRVELDVTVTPWRPKLAKASAILAVVAQALLDARDWGDEQEVRVSEVWEAIEMRVPRAEVRSAVATVTGMLPPPEAVPEGDWRAELANKTATVVGFVKMLTTTISFGATVEGAPVLAAMTALGEQLASEAKWSTRNPRIHPQVVTGPWRHLVFGHPARADGSVDRGAYTFCVLEQFHRHLKRREIYAEGSTRWRNPQARLLDGTAWEAVKDSVLTSLGLPETPTRCWAAMSPRWMRPCGMSVTGWPSTPTCGWIRPGRST